ncbi:neuron navigator 2-like isoform X3 [Babylonia areolata]|uniref:neuron navigator 2-like isoform X3 n=1 Tax=Babylonia areolata TaxID=304850 RepID=UPI003FD06274
MVLEYIVTVWDSAEPKVYNSQIYMDWANHYLEKARNNKFITDLQHDVTDGVLLAEVIEAVTNEKIKDIKQKPKNSAQMVENINTCLTFLATLGVSVEGVSAKDIKEGNLKAILGLFFSLSRFKQQQKSQQREQQQQAAHLKDSGGGGGGHRGQSGPGPPGGGGQDGGQGGGGDHDQADRGKGVGHLQAGDPKSRLPSPGRQTGSKSSSGTSNKDSSRSARSQGGEKGRLYANQQNPAVSSAAGSSSASSKGVPSGNNNTPQPATAAASAASSSGIPTAIGRGRPGSGGDKQSNRTSASSTSSTSSSKSSSSKPSTTSSSSSSNKNSMLDKFKFFNKDKDKKAAAKGAAKSSSGGGSGRGEGGDVKVSGRSSSKEAAASGSTSGAHGPSSSADVSRTPCSSSSKVGKKSVSRALSGKRDGGQSEDSMRLASPSPSLHQLSVSGSRAPSPSAPASSPSQSRRPIVPSGNKLERGDPRGDPRLGHASPTLSKKSSKLGSFIPTTKPAPSSSSSGKSRASSTGVSSPAPSASGQPPPTPTAPPPPLTSAIPTGIPKPQGSRSGSKGSKEEKGQSRGKEHKAVAYSGMPGVNPNQVLVPTSSSSRPCPQPSPQQVPLTQQQLQRHHQHLQQLQLQQQQQHKYQQQHGQTHSRSRHHEPSSSSYSDPSTPPTFTTFNPPSQGEPGYANIAQSPTSPQSRLAASNSSHSVQGGHARVNVQQTFDVSSTEGRTKTHSLERQQSRDAQSVSEDSRRQGDPMASPSHPHYVPVNIPPQGTDGGGRPSEGGRRASEGGGRQLLPRSGERGYVETVPVSPLNSPSVTRHALSPNSSTTAVNVVKPTSHNKATKADCNTQTNLSVLKKSSAHKRLEGSHKSQGGSQRSSPKSEVDSEHSISKGHHGEERASPTVDRSSPKHMPQNVTEESVSSRSSPVSAHRQQDQSSQARLLASDFSCAAQMRSMTPATTNSPKLGVKMLNSHLGKPANNVAIVQPRHGEKIETTFDSEVRTEMKPSSGKETTFTSSEEKTTFVDDAGEAMDIKPMPPIMRALPYGYFRGYTGYSGLSSSRNFHIPGISVPPAAVYPARAQSHGFGVNRTMMDPSKFYSGHNIKRAGSNCPSVGNDTDYGSDIETYDYVSGYMSDGDILKSNNRNDDWSSGYLSEGGASLYARRLQQRFREGMQAVKECMQKSSGLMDDDSFDDSSSISSGDISDTIAEISTDENLTGSSQGALSDTNVYNSLKRMPRDIRQGFLQHGQVMQQGGKRAPNLGTSAFMGSDYHSDSGVGGVPGGWRKYSLPQSHKVLSSDSSDYGYSYSIGGWSTRSDQQEYSSYRKLSTASHPEFYPYGDSGYGDSTLMRSERSSSPSTGSKRDCETNTDQSHLMDANSKAQMAAKMGKNQNGNPASQGAGFGYRRPLSNTSGSSSGKGSGKGSSVVGCRLAKHGVEGVTQMVRSGSDSVAHTPTGIPRPASATSSAKSCHSDMASEANRSSTLERKQRTGLTPSKSMGAAQTDFQSNSLGRRRLFGSKSSVNQKGGENGGGACNSTIISNPHATYSKDGSSKNLSHYVNLQELHARQQQQQHSHYVPLEFPSGGQRHSGGSATGMSLGPGFWHRNSHANVPAPALPGQEGESMDTLVVSASSPIQQQIQQARALSGVGARILQQHRETLAALSVSAQPSPCPSPNPSLQRSSSVKSERSLASMSSKDPSLSPDPPHLLSESFSEAFDLASGAMPPTSPSPSNSSQTSRFTYPLSFTASSALAGGGGAMVRSNTQTGLPYSSSGLCRMTAGGKEEEGSLHGSNLSLVSTSSSHSVYSSSEEKHAAEVRKLRRDLESAQAKVHTLTSQLSTNAHVVSAFEQSLANMTARLQALTSSAEQKVQVPMSSVHSKPQSLKDSELNDLRITIEALKRQSGLGVTDPTVLSPTASRRHTSPAMAPKDLHAVLESGGGIARQISSDSVSSINSLSSACSLTSQQSAATDGEGRKGAKNSKKKGWLRSSFSKAFSGKKTKKIKTGSLSDVEPDTHSLRSNASAPNSPLMQVNHMPGTPATMKGSHSSGALSDVDVGILKQQLRDKDAKLTDIRLEALSSAHQLEQLRETMTKMKNEMSALKADNDRLHKLMSTSRSITFPQSSSPLTHARAASNDSLDRSLSLTDQSSLDMLLAETAANDRDGKRVTITVYQGSNPDPSRPGIEKPAEVLIGSLSVSGKTKWDILDNIVRKIFKEYVLRVDPVTNLGLSAESVFSYHLGEITRTKDSEVPELLPIGYLVGDTTQIGICLKGTRQQSVDSLAFETMIPKSIIQRYVSLLLEHRRIILCGPSGTGKTYLAQKLAEHLVLRSGKELTAGCVAVFNVDHKSAKELRQYLANIADQCEATSASALPSVVILDNLHHVVSLADVFNGFLTAKYQKCPYIIGTMNQSTCSTTNLQLHHNFRWVLCANHMEPVKGFLGRFLRRKLVEAEVRTGTRNNDLNRTIDWIPKVWTHVNKFLETHSSSDVTIGPRLFLSCPMDIAGSQVWFTDLWNYSVVPYIIEAVRDGLQVYGKRAPWEDPTEWAMQTYPWSNLGSERHLLPVRSDDVGYDSVAPPTSPPGGQLDLSSNKKIMMPCSKEENVISSSSSDPLVSMLKKLHEVSEFPVDPKGKEVVMDSSHTKATTTTTLPHADHPH